MLLALLKVEPTIPGYSLFANSYSAMRSCSVGRFCWSCLSISLAPATLNPLSTGTEAYISYTQCDNVLSQVLVRVGPRRWSNPSSSVRHAVQLCHAADQQQGAFQQAVNLIDASLQLRAALVTSVYAKSLTISQSGKRQFGSGQITVVESKQQ